jgi:hypothetical protein
VLSAVSFNKILANTILPVVFVRLRPTTVVLTPACVVNTVVGAISNPDAKTFLNTVGIFLS